MQVGVASQGVGQGGLYPSEPWMDDGLSSSAEDFQPEVQVILGPVNRAGRGERAPLWLALGVCQLRSR